MSVQIKTIKKRIESVRNIKKITKAMEMVSSYKMKRAINQALQTRAYAKTALELLSSIRNSKEAIHPLLEIRDIKNILVVIFASNKGLCGSYNANVFKKVREFIKKNQETKIDFITIGKKAEGKIEKEYGNYVASFIEIPDNPKIEDVFPCVKLIIDGFLSKKYDQVSLIYTDFISPIKYEVLVRQLLPVSENALKELIARISARETKEQGLKKGEDLTNLALCLFEPSVTSVLNEILPHLTEIQLYQSLLESNACEHSSRMITMKNASESATDMIEDLSFSFNQARQSAITQEILEIASGSAKTED